MHVDAAAGVLDALPVSRAPRSVSKKRDVLVQFHIFKNAGMSVDQSLQQYFGADWIAFDPPAPDIGVGNNDLVATLEAQPNVAAVSSHQLRFPLGGSEHIRLHTILLLRHPIDRVRSIYDYER